MALQIRRGTSADVTSASFVPLLGEPLYLTDNQKLYIGDGSTPGGNAIGGAEDLKDLTSVTLIDEAVGALDLYSVTSNTVLITLSVGQSAYYVGLQVVISNSSVAALNGTHTITSIPTGSQFTFTLTTADVTSASVTGVVTPKIPNGDALIWNETNSYWENAAVLTDIVNDITPQLGGNLDTNNKTITSTGTNNIEFDPATGQEVIFKGNATDGSGRIKLNCENNSHGVVIKGPPHSAAANYTLTLPTGTGTSGQLLETDGSGSLSWATATATGSNTLHTTLMFDGGSTAPTSTISNSDQIGLNFGTWSTLNSAGTGGGPSSSTYDPTLTGISFDATNGYFIGFPRGRYEINFSATIEIDNVIGNINANKLYYFGLASDTGSPPNYSYFADCIQGVLPYASYGSASTVVNATWNLIAVFEETTAANNKLEVYADQDMGPTHFVMDANLNILKFADI